MLQMREGESVTQFTIRRMRTEFMMEAISACFAEKIENPDNADDETYNRAIDHCAQSISALVL